MHSGSFYGGRALGGNSDNAVAQTLQPLAEVHGDERLILHDEDIGRLTFGGAHSEPLPGRRYRRPTNRLAGKPQSLTLALAKGYHADHCDKISRIFVLA